MSERRTSCQDKSSLDDRMRLRCERDRNPILNAISSLGARFTVGAVQHSDVVLTTSVKAR